MLTWCFVGNCFICILLSIAKYIIQNTGEERVWNDMVLNCIQLLVRVYQRSLLKSRFDLLHNPNEELNYVLYF
ncbi:hypothetical protein KP509_37G061900 [Ceratopteris richardii]|uniref:Uncharacterized protein n=1 Tax=Ceratopteris richardii TaxID=49495 RepID=A0A8T2QAS1_CERRI|nr:hypothetical protein KP509_37G061900 [Ceratopteris richardii]